MWYENLYINALYFTTCFAVILDADWSIGVRHVAVYINALYFTTCFAVILDADWSIGVRHVAVHTMAIYYGMFEFNIEHLNLILHARINLA